MSFIYIFIQLFARKQIILYPGMQTYFSASASISLHHDDNNTLQCLIAASALTQIQPRSIRTSLPGAGDVFVSLAPDGGAGWGEEGGALVLGASLRLQHMHCDFVLAGEQQAGEVDVVLLSQETHYSAMMTLTCHPGQVPWSFKDN